MRENFQADPEVMAAEMRDDGLFIVVCGRGHRSVTALQQQKFEVLFEIGAMALLDGYPREAVTSMASALERFYEYYTRVISIKNNIVDETYDQTWKWVVNQSERQFGAYLFVYMMENRAAAATIEDVKPELSGASKAQTRTWREFRNAVVHKGYIPTSDEALAYGDIVYSHINAMVDELKKQYPAQMEKATFKHLSRAFPEVRDEPFSTMGVPTVVSLSRGDSPAPTLGEALQHLRKYMGWLHIR
ncbi:MAG: hypothetical protein HYT87_02875 [Nitrospirae bacterium]|nr:hypothetical protein [Nitrospirota bacterium]